MKALGKVCLLGIGMTYLKPGFWRNDRGYRNPNGLMAVASRPDAGGLFEIEAADDFIVNGGAVITSGTFTGLLTSSVTVPTVQNVIIEIYRVFPLDSDTVRFPKCADPR